MKGFRAISDNFLIINSMHKSISEHLWIFLQMRKPWLLKSDRELYLWLCHWLATNSKSSKYQIYSSARLFYAPQPFTSSQRESHPTQIRGYGTFLQTFIPKTHKEPKCPCFAPNYQANQNWNSTAIKKSKNQRLFQVAAKLCQVLCVKFCKDLWPRTMGLRRGSVKLMTTIITKLVLPEYQRETNGFLFHLSFIIYHFLFLISYSYILFPITTIITMLVFPEHQQEIYGFLFLIS